jgi:hypothetical protein
MILVYAYEFVIKNDPEKAKQYDRKTIIIGMFTFPIALPFVTIYRLFVKKKK